jgi:chitin synthase
MAYTITLWVYAFLALYLIICSFYLTGVSFKTVIKLLKSETASEVATSFFKPPVGPLVAALVGTFGIYFFASFLYVSIKRMSLVYVCLY